MFHQKPSLLPSLLYTGLCVLFVFGPVSGSEIQSQYGYQTGEIYSFTDSVTETFDMNDTYLLEQAMHSFQIQIQTVEENVANYTILITVQILNLSAGLEDYLRVTDMEGHTPIVASPFIYFTHTQWDLHVIDFLDSAEDYMAATQMSGSVNYDLETRYFTWNLSKYISTLISPYDIDDDEDPDAYTSISRYSATFTEKGVLQSREFITEFRFTNGARYCRARRISLDTPLSVPQPIIFLIIIGVLIVSTLLLVALTIFWTYRQLTTPTTRR
ncbi:MAG: hypothetical protein ACFE89_12760 [Candidatus Hodarchaeota archaeon]